MSQERSKALDDQGSRPPWVDVVVDLSPRIPFTYRVPESMLEVLEIGHRVSVPFHNRPRLGVVVAWQPSPQPELIEQGKLQPILDILDREPILPPGLVSLIDWMSRYYFSPPGQVLRLMLPSQLRVRAKRLVRLSEFGARCMQAGLLEDELLERVARRLWEASRALSDERLRKDIDGLTYVRLDEMAEQGVLEFDYQKANAKKGRQIQRYLRGVGFPPESARLGAKQMAVLRLLEGRERVPLREVQKATEASATTLRSLVKRGWVVELEEETLRDPFDAEDIQPAVPVELTDEQRAAIREINGDGGFREFRSLVLHGITGSGKTQVYLECIAAALEAGRQALLLLPEIALTPQLVAIFRGRFPDSIAVLHSGLSEGQRFDQWRRIRRDEVQVVIGARSAIFAPLTRLGMLVVDEEHDGSFKQDNQPRYSARDLALVRGKSEGAVVVLGSATPSLESLQNSREGRSRLISLTHRPTGQPLPEVQIVDMRQLSRDERGMLQIMSPTLKQAIHEVVEQRQQVILFLNRRGHSPSVVCSSCGHDWSCPHCEITLTYHRRENRLCCHYCEFSNELPERCQTCDSDQWLFLGAGTEKLADRLGDELAGYRVGRLDRDTSKGEGLRQIIRDFRSGLIDVLVGTQMVTKGHDFPNVTLVGVVMADLSLRIPDFRSGERTFQLLAQVSGRAGRGLVKGRVIIQTYLPHHPVIQAAAGHDYEAFAAFELETRQALGYPPFGYLIGLRFEGVKLEAVQTVAAHYQKVARQLLQTHRQSQPGAVTVLGPVESPLARLKGRHRWQMLVKAGRRSALRQFVVGLLNGAGYGRGDRQVTVILDVDPLNML